MIRGIPTSIKKKPAAQVAPVVIPSTGQQRRSLSRLPADITAGAKVVTASCSDWGITVEEAKAGGAALYVQIDPQAALQGYYLGRTLGDAPPVLILRSGVTPERVADT